MSTFGAQALPHRPALGVHPVAGGVEVSVAAPHATRVWLCVFDGEGSETRIELPGAGDGRWGGFVADLGPGTRYGFRVDGPWRPSAEHRHNPAQLLLDPYARAVEGTLDYVPDVYGHVVTEGGRAYPTRRSKGDSAPFVPRSVVVDPGFDWGQDAPPAHPRDERVLYEVHVREMTMRLPGIPEHLRGTYAGLAHPVTIEHLRGLGVTSVELLPVHAFTDEPHLRELGHSNHWGYNTLGFFAPHAPYAGSDDPGEVLLEFKGMVKLLHEAGIEVLLDVVYNHTAEQGVGGATLCWRGLGAANYYRLDQRGHDVDVTGCGNTLDVNDPIALAMVLDSLRYWVGECHVDGFRYDLAFALGRDADLEFDPEHPFFVALREDPLLSRVLHIAEPWDIGPHGWGTGRFPEPWAEWNDRFRDTARDFWLADAGALSTGRVSGPGVRELATRLVGSRDLFAERSPLASVDFVTAHDGFTLADLVSFEAKHNEANGEDNRDGNNHNRSWNHGAEGPTDDVVIALARRRSVRNLLGTLLLSAGVPMIAAGDEIARTTRGNNNPYCQDNELTWLDWNLDEAKGDLLATAARLTALRRELLVLRGHEEWQISWFDEHGMAMSDQTWAQDGRRTLQLHLAGEPSALIIVHGGLAETEVNLPDVGELRLRWDSAWERPHDPSPAGSKATLTPLSMHLYSA